MIFKVAFGLVAIATLSQACTDSGGSGGPPNGVLTRMVRRAQPEAHGATHGPRAPLEWGQLNILHTSDTHGWLEGHLKQANYGADWGDFVSFAEAMKRRARSLGVDLLLVDTGVDISILEPTRSELTIFRICMMGRD
jgi:2',3'-cyclic-nucleotide 2'-phosphodiesterase (5'-nucleotidase family)